MSYTSEEIYDYWLRIDLLNPDLGDKTLNEFGEAVAVTVLEDLANNEDFEKIEVVVTRKRGFIVHLNSSTGAFFYRDSLRNYAPFPF